MFPARTRNTASAKLHLSSCADFRDQLLSHVVRKQVLVTHRTMLNSARIDVGRST
jgi:hypothetical protein